MMSFFRNLLGGGQTKKPTKSTNQGLEDLENSAEMLRKRLAHLQDQAIEQEKIAKANATTNKSKALQALKKKRNLEENIKKTEAMLENIEGQKDILENASSNAAVLKTMAETARIVKQEHDNLDINKVEDIVDEIREQKEISEEVGRILTMNDKTYDDDELLKELENMQQEQLDAKLLQPENPLVLPDAPVATPTPAQPVPSTSSDKELDELQKWASAAQ